jgi:hypothetical protein
VNTYLTTSDDLESVIADGGPEAPLQRWTEQTGQQALPHLPGQWTTSVASATSADGSILFGGSGNSSIDFVMGFWLPNGVRKTLHDVLLEQGLGSSIDGWTFRDPYYGHYLSADGQVLAGNAFNADGDEEGFVVYLDPLIVPEPASTGLVIFALITFARSRPTHQKLSTGPWR